MNASASLGVSVWTQGRRALWGLAWTQYLDLVRQPVYGVVLAMGLILVAISPFLAVFSLGRADALVLDLGASAMLFFMVFLAAGAAAAGQAERVGDGTAGLILTHPASPFVYLAGQTLGSVLALAQASVILGVALLWAARHGSDHEHLGVLVPAGCGLLAALAWGLRASLARRHAQPAIVGAASLLFPLLYLASLRLDAHLKPIPAESLPGTALAAASLTLLAACAFLALGSALAARLGPAATTTLTLSAFLLSSLVRGPLAELGALSHLTWLLPDLQLFWVGDAAYLEREVPAAYVGGVALYTALYMLCMLALGGLAMERRELV